MTTPKPETHTEPPVSLVSRVKDLRAKSASAGLSSAEETEYRMLGRVLDAYEQAKPIHQTRLTCEQDKVAMLREFEAHATEVWERMEYLQGIRKEPPVPRKQVFKMNVKRPVKL